MSLNFASGRRLRDGFLRPPLGSALLHQQDSLERRDAARAELAPRRPPELLEGLRRRPRGAVDACGQHRIERVGDVDDPGTERDLLSLEPIGVPRTVVTLVVVTDRRDGVDQEAEAIDDART